MKKIFAITLLSVYLFSTTGFGQVLKSPVLVHHYFDHVQDDRDISFIDFLAKHYPGKINHYHQGSEQQEHKDLPFKSPVGHFVQAGIIVPQCLDETDIVLWIPIAKKRPHGLQDYSASYLNTIWQPPRESGMKS